ncbi:cyclase family protein [Nocardioides sp. WS12]|uniref:cyclase family protein n=1 Tax=Nocardioides sp. WS12 TaxID=2486272 RepID=UPI0015FCA941|nr:cyclase family protein [Nocardioides sp. WS12]
MTTTDANVSDSSNGPEEDDWRAVATRVRNWGRWGDDDELGTLNHITPEAVQYAATLARRGKVIPLSVPLNSDGPQDAFGLRRNPVHLMSVDGGDDDAAEHLHGWGGRKEKGIATLYDAGPARYADDWIMMPCQAGTQWDALSHVFYEGKMYNGYPSSAVTSLGATKASIEPIGMAGGVVGRGVLLDVARHRGVDRLEPHTAITPEELDDVVATQGVELRTGDIIVIRTGWWQEYDEKQDGHQWFVDTPGVHWRVAEWLHLHNAAAVAADNISVESQPPANGVRLCFHMLAIRDMGMMLGEIWDLEELGADCASNGTYDFLLVAPALPITGAVGTPVNPIAIR